MTAVELSSWVQSLWTQVQQQDPFKPVFFGLKAEAGGWRAYIVEPYEFNLADYENNLRAYMNLHGIEVGVWFQSGTSESGKLWVRPEFTTLDFSNLLGTCQTSLKTL